MLPDPTLAGTHAYPALCTETKAAVCVCSRQQPLLYQEGLPSTSHTKLTQAFLKQNQKKQPNNERTNLVDQPRKLTFHPSSYILSNSMVHIFFFFRRPLIYVCIPSLVSAEVVKAQHFSVQHSF